MINFPKNIKRLRIDIGTGPTAPNSAFWLHSYNDLGVILFEPDPRSFKLLNNGGKTNFYSEEFRLIKNKIYLKNKLKKNISGSRIKIINCAISNVGKLVKFYMLDEKFIGNSSLSKPKSNFGKYQTKLVAVKKLDFYLKNIDWKKIKYIEYLKIDTQGNDLKVIKSAKNYIDKVCFIQAEYWANQEYYGENSRKYCFDKIKQFMKKRNFQLYYFTKVDAYFVNKKKIDEIIEENIIDSSIDFKTGLFRKSFLFGYPIKLIIYANIVFFLRKFNIFNFIIYNIFKINLKKFLD